MAWIPPRTWVAGEVVTAALLNAEVRDNLKAIGDPWTAYTPAWTAATTNPALGNGTLAGEYVQAGKLIHFSITLTMGTTTTYGTGDWIFTLPIAGAGANTPLLMSARLPGNRMRGGSPRDATTFSLYTEAGVAVDSATLGWGSGNIVAIAGTYEAA